MRPSPVSAAEYPIVPGFYPDPTICRVGADYYVAHSSFEYFPGAPIFHSRDLVSWRQIGNILDRRAQFRPGDGRPSGGIYGSTLRFHGGRFWFVTTNVYDFGAGQVIVSAEDPAGPWSDPVFVGEALGIDPDLCWDRDGRCHLTWKATPDEGRAAGIMQARIDPATGRFDGEAYPVWQGIGLAEPEAPHLYDIDGRWYLMLAEGGTERGHCVTVARGDSPQGPFESCPANPVFTHRSTSHSVQNTGHADLVRTEDGGWAAVYLAVRPRGYTPSFHVLGRETFLAGVDWVDGWPVFDEGRFAVPPADTSFVDDFSAGRLDVRWVVPGGEPEAVGARRAAGGFELRPSADGSAGLLCVRVRDLAWRAEAVVEGSGRFVVLIDDRHWYGLTFDGGRVTATARVGDLVHDVDAAPVGGSVLTLRIEAVEPTSASGPDEVVLSFKDGDGFRELGRLDGRYLSTEVAAGFTGRVLGVGAVGAAPAVVRRVEYAPA